MPLSAGDRVDRYVVMEFLGSGGMGEVYRARDPKLQRQVALKILRVDRSGSTGSHQRLLREARAVATISHPNVLSVFDVGELEEPEALRGVAYIAMELVVGSSLRAHVGDASVSIDRRLGWLRDIARALVAAHEAGIVHRDVKPENVMIGVDGAVKVLDFGVARSMGAADTLSSTEAHSLPTIRTDGVSPLGGRESQAATADGKIVGTLYYMAPEQLRAQTVDGRADQFAWGVVAHELLVGSPPWTTSTDPIAVASQVLSRDLRPPAEIDRRIPRAASDTIARALSKDAAARFRTMRDVLIAMDDSTATLAAHSPRSRVWAVGVAAVVAIGIAAAAFARARSPASARAPVATPLARDGCTSSAACVRSHGGSAWRCNEPRHECVELSSVDCNVQADPAALTTDDALWFGAIYPTRGDDAAAFSSEARALDLARQDFATALGGSAAGRGAMRARPIGLVMCDESVDPRRAVEHLVGDVGVPAVIGFRWARTAIDVIPSLLLPEHVLSFVTIAQSPGLTRIPEPAGEPRLVWRSTVDATDMLPPLAAFVSDVLEPRTKRATPMRVALVRRSAGAHDPGADLFRVLRFNGKSALENGDDFRQYGVDDDAAGGADDVVDALLAFRPDVVFEITGAFVKKILIPLETRWSHGPRPVYLTTAGAFSPEVSSFIGNDPARRQRFFGVTNVSTRMPNAELVLRYNLAFPREPTARTIAPSPSYDAFYTLAYAAISLGDQAVTGAALSGAVDRVLPPGRRVDVGPRGIFDAFGELRAGRRIDLNGAIGPLDFDRATGEAPIDYAIVCMSVDDRGFASRPSESGAIEATSVESGLVYDSAAGKLTGTLRCP